MPLLPHDASTGKYCWKHGKDPIAVWDACKGELTTKIMNFASAIGDNPNAVGKGCEHLGFSIYDG